MEESERFGLIQEIKIDHPDYILFADESGCQTNQKQDGNVGNRKYIVEHGTLLKSFAAPRPPVYHPSLHFWFR